MLEETAQRAYTTALLTGETWEDFVALVEANNGVWGGCWCMGFHPEGLDRTSARQNRENKHSHVRQGTVHQVLVYGGNDCVGWCQYGTPAELPTINNAKAYDQELIELRWFPDRKTNPLSGQPPQRIRLLLRRPCCHEVVARGRAGPLHALQARVPLRPKGRRSPPARSSPDVRSKRWWAASGCRSRSPRL